MELTSLKGIGPKTEELFKKINVKSVEDLLCFFPREYEFFREPQTINETDFRSFATIRGAFTQKPTIRKTKRVNITTGYFKDEVGQIIKVVWFNTPYVKDSIDTDNLYVLRGRTSQRYNVRQMEQPRIFKEDEYDKLINSKQPVYSLTKGLKNNLVTKAVKEALETAAIDELDKKDPIPSVIKEKYDLCERSFAIRNIHFPNDLSDHMKALKRMSFEEIFLFLYMVKKNERNDSSDDGILINENDETPKFIKSLPFELTDAQKKVYGEIKEDMSSGKSMARLVQGDVGAGKTIIALLALMNAAYYGYQGALMAPTEVLAVQHYEDIISLFKEKGIKLNVALLTGSMSQLEKKVVYDALSDGRIDIIIGTHALIQEKVSFKNLGIVITDEQHRFGTKQREALAEKAERMPHVIVMSATPIPRTLALIIYGGMDVSVIDELPKNRKPIKNAIIDDSLRDNAYRLMQKEIKAGHQIYIICPLIEYSDGLDAQNVADYSEMLKDVFDETIKIDTLHGQMSAERKNEIMEKFAEGKTDILVSTTVIEVGVNVPNATIMMIEDANRFGLAALHQLRGRVGRGDAQSYCIFMSNDKSKAAMERLNILSGSNDGFEIAKKDLKLRGPGELSGTRQSGILSFKNFDVYRDADIAYEAIEAVEYLIKKNIEVKDVDIEQSIIL